MNYIYTLINTIASKSIDIYLLLLCPRFILVYLWYPPTLCCCISFTSPLLHSNAPSPLNSLQPHFPLVFLPPPSSFRAPYTVNPPSFQPTNFLAIVSFICISFNEQDKLIQSGVVIKNPYTKKNRYCKKEADEEARFGTLTQVSKITAHRNASAPMFRGTGYCHVSGTGYFRGWCTFWFGGKETTWW